MEDERGGRAGEIQLGELRGPRRKPLRQLRRRGSRVAHRLRRHCRSTFREIGVENRRRLLELVGQAGEVLQLADRLLGLPHAFGGRVHLAAEEIRILPVDRHLGERLDLALDAIELDRHELGVLLRAPVVVEPQLAHRDAVLQRLDDAIVARRPGRRREVLPQLGEPRRDLAARSSSAGSDRAPSSRAAGAGTATAADRARACGSPRRAALIAGGAAHAGGDAAHLEAARVQPLEARARLGRQPREHRDERLRRAAPAPRPRRAACRAACDLRVDRRAEPRHRDEAGQVGHLAGRDERQQDAARAASARRRRRRRGRSSRFHRKRNASFR